MTSWWSTPVSFRAIRPAATASPRGPWWNYAGWAWAGGSTGGYDIFFKIYYTPAESDLLPAMRASSDHSIEAAVGAAESHLPALPPRAISSGTALPVPMIETVRLGW